MTEQQVVEGLQATYGPGVVFLGLYLGRVLGKLVAKLTPIILDAIAEMKMLRASIDDLKKLGPRVDKLELDVNEGFRRIRALGASPNPNGVEK